MVDKVWFDWQQKHPANAKAFTGGAVEHLTNVTDYKKYPTGGPPWLTVSPQVLILVDISDTDVVSKLGDTMPADGMFPEVKVSDVISTTSGELCYVYV